MIFYVIPPIKHLPLMLHGDRIFCLAHLYSTNAKYKEWMNAQRTDGRFITLDNGAAENSLVTEQILLDCVAELHPDEVIAPDVLFNKDQTLSNLASFIEKMKELKLLPKTKIFGCPQGATKQEWLDCYKEMLANEDVSVIGMSKIAIPFAYLGAKNDTDILKARHLCIDELMGMGLISKSLHFLGMGDPREFIYYERSLPEEVQQFFRSTDSCYTVLSALNNYSWDKGEFNRIPTPHDYFDLQLTDSQVKLAKKNIVYFRDLLH